MKWTDSVDSYNEFTVSRVNLLYSIADRPQIILLRNRFQNESLLCDRRRYTDEILCFRRRTAWSRRFGRWRQRRDTRWLLGGPGHTVWLRTWSIAFWRPALIRPADRGLLQQSICLQCWAAIKMFLPIKSTRPWNRAGEMLLYYSLDIMCVHGYLDASHVTFRGEIH